jgi:hypothetical protein
MMNFFKRGKTYILTEENPDVFYPTMKVYITDSDVDCPDRIIMQLKKMEYFILDVGNIGYTFKKDASVSQVVEYVCRKIIHIHKLHSIEIKTNTETDYFTLKKDYLKDENEMNVLKQAISTICNDFDIINKVEIFPH